MWVIKYRPSLNNIEGKHEGKQESGSPFKRINIRGIMISSLPAFISMALILALSKIPLIAGLGDVFDVILQALPIVLAAIAAKQVSDLDEVDRKSKRLNSSHYSISYSD